MFKKTKSSCKSKFSQKIWNKKPNCNRVTFNHKQPSNLILIKTFL